MIGVLKIQVYPAWLVVCQMVLVLMDYFIINIHGHVQLEIPTWGYYVLKQIVIGIIIINTKNALNSDDKN
jgi:hypothetical protein